MKFLRSAVSIFAAVLLSVTLPSCDGGRADDDAPVPAEPQLYLALDVSANNPGAETESRAGADPDYFHPAYNPHEQLNTLDAIVVDSRGIVEGRGHVDYCDGKPVQEGMLRFPVKEGVKKVYLFANVSAASLSGVADFIGRCNVGTAFDAGAIDRLTVEREAMKPFFGDDTDIPMSEKFEVTVDKGNIDSSTNTMTSELFVTRIATKVTVRLSTDTYDASVASRLAVRLTGQARSQYVLPCEAVYDPPVGQPEAVIAPGSGRNITAFTAPDGVVTETFEAHLTGAREVSKPGSGRVSYIRYDPVYLMESPGTEFQLSVMLNAPADYDTRTPEEQAKCWTVFKPLTNLPLLPRNTHVIIDVTVESGRLDCIVTLLPYTGITLEPIFGLDKE